MARGLLFSSWSAVPRQQKPRLAKGTGPVKLSHQDHRQAAPASSASGLVASVARLADGLNELAAIQGQGLAPEHLALAYKAVSEAMGAEHHLAELRERIAELEALAVTDPLTGLLNRRGFAGELARARAGANRYNELGALVFIDLDGFKPVNDTYGHAAGDHVLKRVAQALADNVRATDRVARLGGDEFAVLLPRTRRDDGLVKAEALDRVINGLTVEWHGRLIAVRASLGFQTFGPGDDGLDLLGRADAAMYAAKRLRADTVGRSRGL
jgi:diguanylate cyclase (GGDEF)-like protein